MTSSTTMLPQRCHNVAVQAGMSLNRRVGLLKSQTILRSLTQLNKGHAKILWRGCSYRAILAEHVSSFAPVAQNHLFRK